MDKIPYNIIQGLNCSLSCQATTYMLPRDQIHDPLTPQSVCVGVFIMVDMPVTKFDTSYPTEVKVYI